MRDGWHQLDDTACFLFSYYIIPGTCVWIIGLFVICLLVNCYEKILTYLRPGVLRAESPCLVLSPINEGWDLGTFSFGVALFAFFFKRDGAKRRAWLVTKQGGDIKVIRRKHQNISSIIIVSPSSILKTNSRVVIIRPTLRYNRGCSFLPSAAIVSDQLRLKWATDACYLR